MKRTNARIVVLPILVAILMAGCTVDDPSNPEGLVLPAGEALFANYASLGNSLTAGYMDGGLIMNGQLGSYPRLIAGQLGLDTSIGDSEFSQPYMAFPGIGSGRDRLAMGELSGVLHFDGEDVGYVGYTPLASLSSLALVSTLPTPYHNLGVPGATLHDVMNAYSKETSTPVGNLYFDLINRASFFGNETIPGVPGVSPPYESASMFRQAVAKGPSLATLWIGNNDILGAATSGNPGTDVEFTDTAVFQAEYTALLSTLAGGLVQRNGYPSTIVVANIPNITDIPYFLPKAMFEAALPEALGGTWPWGYAEADAQLVLFPTLTWIADEDNQGSPIPSDKTLSVAEVTAVNTAVVTFNTIIATVAAAVDASGYATVGLVDANSLLGEVTTTYGPLASTHFMFALPQVGGDVAAAARATLFSLDGVHPNNIGYGVVANAFIEKINELAGTDLTPVDLNTLGWDPNYGQGYEEKAGAVSGLPSISVDLESAMRDLFR